MPKAVVAVAAGLVAASIWLPRSLETRFQHTSQARHIFELGAEIAILPETLAIEKARLVLESDGFAGVDWVPVPHNSPSQTDGVNDAYFVRAPTNPNRGSLHFTNSHHGHFVVDIELDGRRLICRTIVPK